jgi:hypothetical protein
VAALTATLILPSLARGAAEPAEEREADPVFGEATPEPDPDEESPPADAVVPPGEAASDVIHPDLAAQAPQPEWVREGYGTGTGVEQDPRLLNRKIRRAGRVTLAGGGIAVLGGVIAITGAVLIYAVNPAKRLNKLSDEFGGALPINSSKRQRLITMGRAAPLVAFTGIGVLVAGVIVAAVARIRLKKLREQRRTSIAFVPTTYGQGAELHWEIKF